jgi:hypothetical protein
MVAIQVVQVVLSRLGEWAPEGPLIRVVGRRVLWIG